MSKKIVCFLLALIMVLGMIPNAAITANAYSTRETSEKAIDILRGSVAFTAKEEDGKIGYGTPTSYSGVQNYISGITKENAVDLMHDYIDEIVDEKINAYVKSMNLDLNQGEHDALAVHYYRNNGGIDALLETIREIKSVNSAADRAAMVDAFVAEYSHDASSNEALKPTLDVALAEAAMYLYGDYGYNGGSKLAFARLDTDADFEGDDVAAYVKADGRVLNPEGSDFLGWFLYDSEKKELTGAPLSKLTADHNGKLIVAKQHSGDNDPAKYTINTNTLSDLNVYSWTGAAPEQTGNILKANSSFKVTHEYLESGEKWVYGSGTNTKGKTVKGWVKIGELVATDPEAPQPIASATVTSNTLNIRPGATTNGNTPIGQLLKGDVVNIYEIKVEKTETGNQNWGKIINTEEAGGNIVTGWINLAYTTVDETLGESGEAQGQTGKIANAESVNIRSTAGITATNKIASLKAGTKVTVLEMNADRTWAKIKWTAPVNGYTQGWVYMHYVLLDSAPQGSTGTASGTVLYTGIVTSNINLNVRCKADVYATKVNSLPTGTKINVYETVTKNGMKWGRIGEDQWVCLSYVNLTAVAQTGSGNGTTSTTTNTQATVTAATLDVLKNYNSNAEKVGTLKKGDVVTILEKNTESTGTGSRIWGRFNNGTISGWINLAYVELKTVTSVSGGTTSGNTSTTTNSNGAAAVISNCVSVNVREGAGVSNAQITRLNSGTAVKVYEQVTKDNAPWAKITWNNGANSGWVCMNYVTMSASSGTAVNGSAVNGTNSNTISVTGYVNSNVDLKVRAGAGLGYAQIGALKKGTKVSVYEQMTADGMIWGRTTYGNNSGWICMSYITVENTSSTGKGVMGTVARCFAAVNVRSAPGTNNALVAKINVGTRVEVFETKTYSNQLWGRVAQGWVCMDYILLDSELPEGEILDAPTNTTQATVPQETVNRDNEVGYVITGTIDNGGNAINVRNDADVDSDRVGTVNDGLEVKILALKNNGAELWGRIDQYATAGWIRMDLVDYSVHGYVNTDEQPVYANADTSSTVKSHLALNQELTFTKLTTNGGTVYGWVDSESAWIPMGRISNTKVDVVSTCKTSTDSFGSDVTSGTVNAATVVVSEINGSKVVFKLASGAYAYIGEIVLEARTVWGKVSYNGETGWVNMNKVNFVLENCMVNSDVLNVRTAKVTGVDNNILGQLSAGEYINICELSFDANGNLWGKVTGNGNSALNGGYVMVTGHVSY